MDVFNTAALPGSSAGGGGNQELLATGSVDGWIKVTHAMYSSLMQLVLGRPICKGGKCNQHAAEGVRSFCPLPMDSIDRIKQQHSHVGSTLIRQTFSGIAYI